MNNSPADETQPSSANQRALRQTIRFPIEQTMRFQSEAAQFLVDSLESGSAVQQRGFSLATDLLRNYARTLERTTRDAGEFAMAGVDAAQSPPITGGQQPPAQSIQQAQQPTAPQQMAPPQSAQQYGGQQPSQQFAQAQSQPSGVQPSEPQYEQPQYAGQSQPDQQQFSQPQYAGQSQPDQQQFDQPQYGQQQPQYGGQQAPPQRQYDIQQPLQQAPPQQSEPFQSTERFEGPPQQ